jgi:iron complex outermembrane receptor protein
MRNSFVLNVFALACVMGPPVAAGQGGTTLSGVVTQADGNQPMAGASVIIDELRLETRTGSDGRYQFEGVPPGKYHVGVRAEGYTTRRTEITVGKEPATLDLVVEFDLHFAEVVSVSPNPRPQFESYQPTSVLTGQDLDRQLDSTVAGTLQSEPGVAMRSFGNAPARPVIRGLDGDRVVVLEDGQRMGDISSQSGDHGVPVNPAATQRMEVVRGPATLLYGASAIGGLVNIISDQIPTAPTTGASGDFTFDLGSNGGQAGAAGDVHFGNGTWAFHLGGSGQRQGNYSTPDGEVENTELRMGTTSLGGSWTREHSYVGGSYAYTDTKYGIPIIEEGNVQLTPRRHAVSVRAGGSGLTGWLQSYRATFGVRNYTHEELEGQEVATAFDNDQVEGELLLSHRKTGQLLGTVGGWFLDRSFATSGAEALSPPVDQNIFAGFLYEEVGWSHATLQLGARVDRTMYSPDSTALPERDFAEVSGSVGLLLRPRAANDDFVVALSLARAARAPALEELYYFGEHHGNFAFEIGNPDLGPEHALGFDVALRGRGPLFEGEISFFNNTIDDYIFRNPISDEEFEEREEEFNDRFGVEDEEGGGEGDGEEHGGFPFVEYTARDARLWGLEAHGDVQVTPEWVAELTFDLVRGSLRDTDEPLPRIPAYRGIVGLRYQRGGLTAGGAVTGVAGQDRVYGEETPTAAYATLRLYGGYSFTSGRVLNTITARLENATNTAYRNHLNYLKDQLLEMGRSFRVVYTIGF